MKLFDRLIERLADEIADRLLAASAEPNLPKDFGVAGDLGILADDRFTDFERSILIKRAQQ